ncbi:MAG: plastocyanin/azurin family copper-binding protein [Gaiellaceae bacterium]
MSPCDLDPTGGTLAGVMSSIRKVNKKMLTRSIAAAVATTAVALLVVATSFGGGSTTQSTSATALRGTVGPGFTIKLTKAGTVVKTLKAGTYKLTVADRSNEHNFVLQRQGGAKRELTSLSFVGTKTATVKLTRGVWTFFCAPHATVMRGRVAVGGVSLARATTTTTRTTTVDDRGGRGELEPGDDRGGHGEPEPGDDRGGHGSDD